MEGVDKLLKQLTGPLALVGLLLLLAAGGITFVVGQVDRLALVVGAIGLALVLFYVLDQPSQLATSMTGRNARYGANTMTMALAFIGIVALLNVLAARYSHRFDLTRNQVFTLSPQSIQVLQTINQPVKITAFYSVTQGFLQQQREDLENLLEEYRRHSPNVQYEFIDPIQQPALARSMGIEVDGTTVLEMAGKRQTVRGSSEGELTSALVKLARPAERKIYFLTGHGELDPESFDQIGAVAAKRQLEGEGFKVETLNLATGQPVPDDASVVIIAAPEQPLLDQEKQALNAYLDRGGKAMVLAAPGQVDVVNELAQKYGLNFAKGVAIDAGLSLRGDPRALVVDQYQPGPITQGLNGKATVFPYSASIDLPREPKPNVQVTVLARTTDRSWLETDQQVAQFDEGKDVRGPLPIAVSVAVDPSTEPPGGGEQSAENGARLIFVANVDFMANAWLDQALFNRDLFLNMVNWLTEDENLIAIRAKGTNDDSLLLSASQSNLALLLSVVALPLAVLVTGGVVYWRRR